MAVKGWRQCKPLQPHSRATFDGGLYASQRFARNGPVFGSRRKGGGLTRMLLT